MMRLNRYLSACGLGSRRGVEQLILDGKVRINGQLVTSLATTVNESDEVSVRGQRLAPQRHIVIALHKPKGYVCTRSDEQDRKTIYDLLPREHQSLHHIGRLDMDSSGLILLTNDGALSHRLAHPSHGVEKEYEVTVEEPLDETVPHKLIKGMITPEGRAWAERAWLYSPFKLGIVLKQGLKRQIRHMLYQLGHEVSRLVRVRVGCIYLKGMEQGGWHKIPEKEIKKLLAEADRKPTGERRIPRIPEPVEEEEKRKPHREPNPREAKPRTQTPRKSQGPRGARKRTDRSASPFKGTRGSKPPRRTPRRK